METEREKKKLHNEYILAKVSSPFYVVSVLSAIWVVPYVVRVRPSVVCMIVHATGHKTNTAIGFCKCTDSTYGSTYIAQYSHASDAQLQVVHVLYTRTYVA